METRDFLLSGFPGNHESGLQNGSYINLAVALFTAGSLTQPGPRFAGTDGQTEEP